MALDAGLSHEELLAKLDQWLAALPETPSIFDVIKTGDSDLLGAYILRAFREAAREAVLHRLESVSATFAVGQEPFDSRAVFRLVDGLMRAWSLTHDDQCRLLGLTSERELETTRELSDQKLPTEIIERTSYLLDIFQAITALVPDSERANDWVRMSNTLPLFGAASALEVMTDCDAALRRLG